MFETNTVNALLCKLIEAIYEFVIITFRITFVECIIFSFKMAFLKLLFLLKLNEFTFSSLFTCFMSYLNPLKQKKVLTGFVSKYN